MLDPGLVRFLELVVRELGAADARIELGGAPPTDPRLVYRTAQNGGRVVVVFDSPPPDRTEVEGKLDALLGPLFGSAEHTIAQMPVPRTPPDSAKKRLDDELGRLAERAGARGAVVFDFASPVVWGASPRVSPASDDLLEQAIGRVREAHAELRPGHTARLEVRPGAECITRPFAGLYAVVLAFDGPLSEPVALGALLHAMPAIERLVLALPPVDPSPGGKVVRMPVRLR